MSTNLSTRAPVRAVEAPFVLVLGALGVGVAARVAWAARGGALVLVAPPVVVAALVVAGTFRVWRDLAAAAGVEGELVAMEGREGEVSETFVRQAKDLVDRASSTLPSVCILVGLLGTFAGLFEALVGSRDLLATAVDAAALRAVVGAPLAGLARAFGSSAAGIVGSVVLGLSEGRFQRVADAIAVRLEIVDDKRRTLAIGAHLREALASASGAAADQAAREERLTAVLERVARAVEPLASANEATRTVLAENQSLLRELATSVRVGSEASAVALREGAAQSAAALRASAEEGQGALRASQEALMEALRTAAVSATSAIVAAAEETRRTVESSNERTAASLASSSTEASRAIEAASLRTEASVERLVREVGASTKASAESSNEALTNVLAGAARAVDGAASRLVASVEATSTAQRAEVEASREAQTAHIAKVVSAQEATLERFAAANGAALEAFARATDELRAYAVALGDGLRSRDEAAQAATLASLENALGAWAKRDEERYAREESERRARWEDDDARRAEWSGAEKLVLQSAMEIVAERLAAVAEVHGRVAGTVEAASAVLRQVEVQASRSGEAASAQRAHAEESFHGALKEGAKAIADTLAHETRTLVVSLREELAHAGGALEARAREVAEGASRAEGAALERVTSLESAATAMSEQARDVARAVETLAEVLRSVPLEGGPAASSGPATNEGAGGLAPQGAANVQNDEDRAAFVACLEEARRWFDASQALQQKFLDEATQLRGGGRP